MREKKIYLNKNIAIYGMGITGLSTAKTLKDLGANIFCWDDSKKIREKIKSHNFYIKKFWLKQNTVDKIVISPGIDINKCKIKKYLKKNLKKIITDLDLFFELKKKSTIISITGTNGKSTTCKIIEEVLKAANYKVCIVGNIGNPILSLSKIKNNNIFILEASSYQLQYSKPFRSKYAAILNISADHLERHKTVKNYIKIKSKIFLAQNKLDYSYINSDNKYGKYIKKIFKFKKIKSKLILVNKLSVKNLLNKVDNKYFKSEGGIENLAFVYKIVKMLKVKDQLIIESLNKFKGLSHRQETVYSNKKILCINDSKATSFEACSQSLSIYNNIYWIVGGKSKKKDNFHLKKFKKKIIKAYIIGKNTSFFKKQIKKNFPYIVSNNF